MAKINNQEVIQKLIDELRLYPGVDQIPTELAEKILPVFQINDSAINFQEEGDVRFLQDTTLNDNDKTFTVPTGKKWKVMWGSAIYIATATVGSRMPELTITDGTNIIWFIEATDDVLTASKTIRYLFSAVEGLNTKKGTNKLYAHFPIPKDMILTEGMVIRFRDSIGRDAADDFNFQFMVVESDFTDEFT